MKRFFSFVLSALLLFHAAFGVIAEADQTTSSVWSYDNSIMVCESSEFPTMLEISDKNFIGIDKIVTVSQERKENGLYLCTHICHLKENGKAAREKAIQRLAQRYAVSENPFSAYSLNVSTEPVYVKVGEQVRVLYDQGGEMYRYGNELRVSFAVNPKSLISQFDADTFSNFRIEDYWPSPYDNSDWFEKPEQIENYESPTGRYCAFVTVDESNRYLGTLNILARSEDIVEFKTHPVEEKREFTLLGTAPDCFGVEYNNQSGIANVTALAAGAGEIQFLLGDEVKATRPVVVYTQGDVTGEGLVNAKDALEVLKYAVGKTRFSGYQPVAADLNDEKEINAGDALLILKKAVGLIDQFPADNADAVALSEENFPDPLFRNFVTRYDLNSSGGFSVLELSSVTAINVYGYGLNPPIEGLPSSIGNVIGMEYFSQLKELTISGHDLAFLDVSMFDQLEVVRCHGSSLWELDVSSNPHLKILECDQNNLKELDVSNNVQLTRLICPSNVLREIDITNNPQLKALNCNYNYLTSLDVTNNPELVGLQCDYNEINTLDISKNTKLKTISCNGTGIRQLDVSNKPDLYQLQCADNQLKTIDVTGSPFLTLLFCQNNQIENLDLSGNPLLETLNCRGNLITQLDLSHNNQLEYVQYDDPVAVVGWPKQ